MCVEPLKYVKRIESLEVRAFLNHQGQGVEWAVKRSQKRLDDFMLGDLSGSGAWSSFVISVRRSNVSWTFSLSCLLKRLKRLRRTLILWSLWVEMPSLTLESLSQTSFDVSRALTRPYCPLVRWPQMMFFAVESTWMNFLTSAGVTPSPVFGMLFLMTYQRSTSMASRCMRILFF